MDEGLNPQDQIDQLVKQLELAGYSPQEANTIARDAVAAQAERSSTGPETANLNQSVWLNWSNNSQNYASPADAPGDSALVLAAAAELRSKYPELTPAADES